MKNNVEYINPEGLLKNPAFTQVVVTNNPGRTLYIGGQNAITNKAEIVGAGDAKKQTEQALTNLQIALKACGAGFGNLVKLNIAIVQVQPLRDIFGAAQGFLSGTEHQPAVTVAFVAGLANPAFLIEIDAIAFI